MSRDLIVRDLSPANWEMIQAVAPSLHLSRLFSVSSPEQASAIMLKGFELGLSLTASFEFIQVIQGKPALTPRGALAIVMNSGLLGGLKITETDDTCTVWMKRKGDPPIEYETSWSQSDAIKAQLVKPDSNWLKYPKNMRKWRAVGYCIDFLFADVTGGLKRADEFGADLTESGDVVEGQWSEVAQPTPAPTTPAVTLDSLVEKYGAEAVVVAGEGRIPATQDEVDAVAAKLEASNG